MMRIELEVLVEGIFKTKGKKPVADTTTLEEEICRTGRGIVN